MTLDVRAYNVALTPNEQSTAYGGALSLRHSLLTVPMTAASQLTAVSTSASDTFTLRVQGFRNSGVSFDESITLNGTTPVASVLTDVKALEDASLGATAAGTISITQATGTLLLTNNLGRGAQGTTRASSLVWAITGDVSGGSSTIYYGCIGFSNCETLAAALACSLTETSDTPGYGAFGCDSATGLSSTVANRLTAMPGITYNSSDKNLPGDTNLDAGEYIRVPIQITLPAGVSKGQRVYSVSLRYSEA